MLIRALLKYIVAFFSVFVVLLLTGLLPEHLQGPVGVFVIIPAVLGFVLWFNIFRKRSWH